ncbi:hypothetical protein [Blastococcus sp. SYSU D01042]
MRRIRALLVVLAALAVSLTGLSSASAAPTAPAPPRAPEIGFVTPIAWTTPWKADSVQVLGTYRCWGGEPIHLWVSVKQGGPNPTVEGSSTTVDAWYDTNISQDVAVTCNGRWQTKLVTLGRHPVANYPGDFADPQVPPPPPTRPLGYLKNGKAWLQFCLVAGEEPGGLLASKNTWVQVVGAGRR